MNHSLKTRVLSMILAVVMIIGLVPVNVFATEVDGTTPETVVVKFDVNGGIGEYEDQEVIPGNKVTKPEEDPTHETATFAYWTADLEANEEWNFEEDAVTEAMTLYASWTVTEVLPIDEEEPEHVHAGGTATCTELAVCECGEAYGELADHTPSEDGTVCTVCEASLVEAEPEHVHAGGTATCTELAVCECGEAYGELADHTPSEDGTVCTVCEASLVEAEPEHVHAGGTATCTELAVCECGEAYGELAEHTPTEDDGDCTTEVVCTVCGDVTTEAAETHTPNEEGNACAVCGAEIPLILIEEEKPTYKGGLQLGMTDCDYYNIIESSKYTLVPGATEYQYIINGDDASRRQVVHVIEVDTKNPNVSVMPSFKNISTGVDYNDSNNWGSITVTDHAAHAENDLGKNVVGGMNVSLSWDFTHPYGLLIYEGEVLHDSRFSCEICGNSGHPGGGDLVIYKDGTAELRDAKQPLTGEEWMAQTVCFSYIVKDGVNMHTSENHTAHETNDAPRSVIGIKEDGTLVMMMVDGRMSPYSAGFNNHEMAEIMIALGCVDAINCDGGGSSTFMTEREGSGALTVKSRFSDGSERQTLTALLVLSNVAATGEFDHATIETDVKFVTPGSAVTFTATGVDGAGGPAEMPENVSWQLTDDTMGTVENGVFVSNGTVGTATVQVVYEGNVVGEGSVEVVIPESISFAMSNITVPYTKTVNLDVIATYGYNEVTLKADDLVFALENENIGTISGTSFTATDDTTVIDPSKVTVTLVHNTELTAEASIVLGRGSEIVYDFETGAQSIENWSLAYKGVYTPEKYYFNDQLSVVSSSEGKVRNGDYALKVTVDGDSITCMNWCQTRINGLGIDLTDAVSLSMWIYIPEGSHGMEWDIGNAIPVGLGHEFKYGTGWQYFTMPVSEITTATTLDQIRLYHSDTNNTAIGYDHTKHPNYYADVVYYIDDITINYSSAVDDNDAPIISNAKISYEGIDTAVAMTGQTLPTNKVAFTANAADNASGLDTSSVAVYVDGMAVAASCSDTGMISTGDITLANGSHVVRFEISDKMGNKSSFYEYYFVLNGTSVQNTVNYVPKDPTLTDVGVDSLVWMNLEATAIENVEKITTVIDLDQNSKWELDHMELAEGFTATYSVNSETNDATIVITRTGTVTVSGNAVLASLPVRVWYPAFGTSGNEDAMAYRLMAVMSHVEMGLLTETDGNTVSFGSLEHTTMTEWNSTRLSSTSDKMGMHAHTAETMEDVAATCTKAGYEGRTFCAGCNSVVAWGTTTPAIGHHYDFDAEGVLKCTCGELFTGVHTDGKEYVDGVTVSDGWIGESYYVNGEKLTGVNKVPAPNSTDEFYYDFGENGVCENQTKYSGLFFDGEVYRYSYLGVITTGWQLINGEQYYFLEETQAAAVGEVLYLRVTYTFEETGRLTSGQWFNTGMGERYYYGPDYYRGKWADIDGARYYFDAVGHRYEGYHFVTGAVGNDPVWYDFGEDGKLVGKLDYTGLMVTDFGTYYLKDGVSQYGLYNVDGDYYYFRYASKEAVKGTTHTLQDNHGNPITIGTYEFDEDGKMIMKNGVVVESGGLFFYEESLLSEGAGFIEYNGDYYYVRSNGQLATGEYYVSTTNGLTEEGPHMFGDDGKAYFGVVDGIYYEKGLVASGGFVEVDGAYYYVRTTGELATGKYYVSRTNGLTEVGFHMFDENGKAYHGPVEENGSLYFYQKGLIAPVGFVECDGAYYYVRSSGELATGEYYVGKDKTNDLTTEGFHMFGADGKAYAGLFEVDQALFYYEKGLIAPVGFAQIDGDYYYIRTNGQAATGKYYVSRTNDLTEVGFHMFGEDGKAYHGVVEENGVKHFYKKGIMAPQGFLEFEGGYYYVRSNLQLAIGKYFVGEAKTNGLTTAGYHWFDENGKGFNGIHEIAEGKYYFENGLPAGKGIVEVKGELYYANSSGKLITGEYYVGQSKTNGYVEEGFHYFDENGKMI